MATEAQAPATPPESEESRYIIVYPQANYNAPIVGGKYQATDPVMTKEELMETLPTLMQTNPNGAGAGIRVYEVNRYIPVTTKVFLDDEPFDAPTEKPDRAKKAKAKKAAVSSARVVPQIAFDDGLIMDEDDYYDPEI